MKKMKQSIKETINQRYLLAKEEEDMIKEINLKIIGWRNYYRTKTIIPFVSIFPTPADGETIIERKPMGNG